MSPRLSPRLRGVGWLVWRQNRTAFWIGLAVTLAVAVYAAIQHQHLTAAIAQQHLDACRGGNVATQACQTKLNTFGDEYVMPMRHPLQLMPVVPLILGLFLGGPLLAQELESGTYRTACTQSVTRLRWFAAKLAVPVLMTAVISGILAAAMTWWWHPAAQVMGGLFPWQHWYPFDGIGPVLVGQSVLLVLVGVTAGLVLRRTVTAMAATLAVGAGVLYLLEQVRGQLWSTVTVTAQHTTAVPGPSDAWSLANGLLSPTGVRVSDVGSCYAADDYQNCMFAHGRTGTWAEIHPASQLWPLQWTETGLCLALAAALAGVCVYWVRRRMT
ncbi:ABC transporter permease [Streptacidiphilus sp. PAMC 29251]